MIDLNELERRIGYAFTDTAFVEAAFTHSSYVNEHKATDNERIEFLGDCVLNFVVGEKLFRENSGSEGALSAKRSALVSRVPLAALVDSLGLMDFLRVGAGVDKSAFSTKARSDLFEALIGAVYLDGGLEASKAVLDKIFFGKVEPERDYISELQVLATAQKSEIEYSTVSVNGAFETTVRVLGDSFVGTGKTKQASRIDAARKALNGLK